VARAAATEQYIHRIVNILVSLGRELQSIP
jgi:hypothetical protein